MRLVYIALGWAAGIVLAATYTATLTSLVWVMLVVVMALVVVLTWRSPYRLFNIVLLAYALGGLRASFIPTTSQIAAYNNSGGLTIEGVVEADPDVRDDRTLLRVRVERVIRGGDTFESEGLVLVRAPRAVDVRYGDRISATGLLITPAEYDTFSYADYLGRRGVFSIMQNTSIQVDSGGHGNPISSWLFDTRRSAQRLIGQHLPEPQAGLLTGILLGNERGIAPDVRDDFNAVGASHVIAISGFNMVIIAGVVTGALGRLTSRRWIVAFASIGVIMIYTLFVGANAAVVRAAIMSSVLVIGEAMRRRTYVPASLAFVALFMSLLNPNVLWDISFQLSFFATLGLALFVDPLTAWFDRLFTWAFPRSIAGSLSVTLKEPLIVTLAAQITTLPLIILYFSRFSLASLAVNLLIVPVQTPLLIIGGLATLAAFIVPVIAQVPYWFDLVFLSWTIEVVRAFATLSFAEVEIHVDARVIILYFVVLIGWAMMHATQPSWWTKLGRLLRKQIVISTILLAGVALGVLMVAVARSRPDGNLHVWFLDVGHSNAVLVRTPGGAHMLVDGGRFPSRLLTAIGDRFPFTDREIEVLVITQPDEFDTAALPAVLERYDIGVALTNGHPNLSDNALALQDALAPHDVVAVRAGYSLEIDDGVRLEVLHPQEQPTLTDSFDPHTVVLRLTYGEVSFLLTSDINAAGQSALLEAGEWPLASVLQLPHHGAAHSLDPGFLEAAQPQVVVLQSDPANRLGDPHPDTLAMLSEDVPLFRTDQGGTIHLWTDGNTLWAEEEN